MKGKIEKRCDVIAAAIDEISHGESELTSEHKRKRLLKAFRIFEVCEKYKADEIFIRKLGGWNRT